MGVLAKEVVALVSINANSDSGLMLWMSLVIVGWGRLSLGFEGNGEKGEEDGEKYTQKNLGFLYLY